VVGVCVHSGRVGIEAVDMVNQKHWCDFRGCENGGWVVGYYHNNRQMGVAVSGWFSGRVNSVFVYMVYGPYLMRACVW